MYNIFTIKLIELVDRYIPKQARHKSGKQHLKKEKETKVEK